MWAKGASHEKLHVAPSKKQGCFLAGCLLLYLKRKDAFLEPPLLLGNEFYKPVC